jgi:hypothetical protein
MSTVSMVVAPISLFISDLAIQDRKTGRSGELQVRGRFRSQQYGTLGTPHMKDVHGANLSFFSPHTLLIAAFFFPQPLLQLGQLCRGWISPAKNEALRVLWPWTRTWPSCCSVGNRCIAGKSIVFGC